jgi:CheY-like chemotaxis protein
MSKVRAGLGKDNRTMPGLGNRSISSVLKPYLGTCTAGSVAFLVRRNVISTTESPGAGIVPKVAAPVVGHDLEWTPQIHTMGSAWYSLLMSFAQAPAQVAAANTLLSDIGRPDEDGYGLIGGLRSQEAERGGFLPAVALTGLCARKTVARSLRQGSSYVLRSRSIRQN